MGKPYIFSDTFKNITIINKRYKKILSQNTVSENELDFFENFYLISRCINAVKKDLRHCKNELRDCGELYSRLCRAVSEENFGETAVAEAVASVGADYHIVFLAELITKCAVIAHISEGRGAYSGVRGLRKLSEIDFGKLFSLCPEEHILNKNEDFKISDDETKMLYRKKAYSLAKRKNISCTELLESISNGQNIGKILFTAPKNGFLTIAAEIIATVILVISAAVYINVWAAALLLLPIFQICSAVAVRISMFFYKTEELPRVNSGYLTEKNSKTLIVVSVLLTDKDSLKRMERHLKKLYYSNCNDYISLCVLADLKGSDDEKEDEDDALLSAAEKSLARINKKCEGNVTLCVRPRVYSKTQQEFIGRERKRGAIEDLVCTLRGEKGRFSLISGAHLPENTKYILALDSDTDLTLDCAEELIRTALHPLNREKYGIFSMRTEVDVECSDTTVFSRLMAGDGGITAYHSSAAERYQDVFGRSIFSGKGLINIDLFYEKCCGKFQPETVLSHDILEGELTGTAYVSQCQALDLFPTNQTSYLKRLHRWVRGDWQNAVFIFSRRPFSEKSQKSCFDPLSKYKLTDNLRRSITPLFSFLCIVISAFLHGYPSLVLLAVGVLSVTVGDILSLIRTVFNMGRGGFSRRFYSGNLPHGVYPIVHAVISLMMLPAEALVGLDGAVRGLYRRLISKKNMLLWTTAQQGEHGALKSDIIFLLPNILSGIFLLALTNACGALAALLFLCDIPFSFLSGKKRKNRDKKIDYLTREQLVTDARNMWQYYADFADSRNNYLPPDNVQQSPAPRTAQRTSPTNIGLMMTSALAAYDMKIINLSTMCTFLENTLNTVEKLKKWHGNLYNWYDTVSLEPISPFFISAVDSGNFVCALTALKTGLENTDDERATHIAERIGKILTQTNLSPFYNEKKALMHIGFDISRQELSNSYYDLLMSEARMTSYYAVATRQAPRKHWEMLGRHLARYKGYSGPVSWTGTMFEFFMPNIFLPAYRNTLEYEGLKFCLLCQKSYARENGIPFGISESGYYDFDAAMNYKYKANGVDRLGLKRDIPHELTVSPYSSYLTLPFERRTAVKNLNRLRSLGIYGQYGFYEAVDFTPSRAVGQDKMLVKSFMAHHIGMSILSIDNALFDNIMQKRFMADSRQMTAESLLRERIPNRPFTVSEKRKKQRVKGVRIRYSPVKITENISKGSISAVYTNGEYTVLCCDNGAQTSLMNGKTVLGVTHNPHVGENGVYAAVFTANGVHAFTAYSDFQGCGNYSAAVCEKKLKLLSSSDLGTGEKELAVSSEYNCEVHSFSLKPQTSGEGYAAVYFQPILCNLAPYLTHRAFAKLFTLAEYDSDKGCVVLKYTFRGSDDCFYCCIGTDAENTVTNLSREDVLTRGEKNVFANFDNLTENLVNIPDSCVAFKIPLVLKKGVKFKFRLVISAGNSREEAIKAYDAGLGEIKGAKSVYSISGQSRELYFKMASSAAFKMTMGQEQISALSVCKCTQNDLWKYGISGDLPLFLIFAGEDNLKSAVDTLGIAESLSKSGIKCETAVVCLEKNPYSGEIRKLLDTGNPAVHFINGADLEKEDENTLICFASWCSRSENTEIMMPIDDAEKACPGSYAPNGLYNVPTDTFLPWSWILADRRFGTLLSDNSLGYSYYNNSQENKITPWINDTRSISGERLWALVNGKTVDIIENSAMTVFSDSVVYSSSVKLNTVTGKSSVKGINFTTKITVSDNKKLIEVSCENAPNGAELAYLINPVLDDRERFPQFIKAEEFDGKIIFYNSLKNDGLRYFVECVGGKAFYSAEQIFERGDNKFISSQAPLIGIKTAVKSGKSCTFILGVENGEDGTAVIPNKISVNTADSDLNRMYNDFLPVQIVRGRVLSRTSFYQCSGAYGFRDQLQDIMSVIPLCPDTARDIIKLCAGAQFSEGDVLHWFHTGNGTEMRGVRTRYSDDLLWLIWAVHEYCTVTGDYSFLQEQIPFLGGVELSDTEDERYGVYHHTTEKADLLNHCLRAFCRADRTGEHSLILMGGGDWNDGFNKIGVHGKGESVFSTQLAVICGEKLSELLKISGDSKTADDILFAVSRLKAALEVNAFTGDRYLRCFTDSGAVLGMKGCTACEIDSLTQSFAVFSGLDKQRCRIALDTAWDGLVDRKQRVIRLFSPSFTEKNNDIGYITAYPSGIRENGGQYTHAAVWLARAMLMNGQTERGTEIMKMLNPLTKYRDGFGDIYKTEPYFLTGDIYYCENLTGRGGWSLYSGSAAWYYKTVTEELLGLHFRGDKLYFAPIVQSLCPFEITVNYNGAVIKLFAADTAGALYCDGKKSDYIPLDGKNHTGKYKI